MCTATRYTTTLVLSYTHAQGVHMETNTQLHTDVRVHAC